MIIMLYYTFCTQFLRILLSGAAFSRAHIWPEGSFSAAFGPCQHIGYQPLSSAPIALSALSTRFIAPSACSSVRVPSCERIEIE